MIVSDGQVITAGAAFGHSDLMLHLFGLRFGPALAKAIGKFLLIDGRQAQAPFVGPDCRIRGLRGCDSTQTMMRKATGANPSQFRRA
ncbi:hypothetical protein [Limnobacter sp.]|uniref:hypothetical protein n=1 Tax=Limnobacter sp. TaxID=2003368 RepID=UPI002FE36221